jgi:hypothetical protein
MRTMSAAAVALWVAAFSVVRADAQEPQSEVLIRRGVELRRSGQNGEALVEFRKAFALDPTPRARAQIGLALQSLGDWLGAERWLQEALQARDDKWIELYRGALSGALAITQTHLARLTVDTNVREGEIQVNASAPQALPLAASMSVVAGPLDIVVRAPGYTEVHRRVEVQPGAEAHETFVLAPLTPVGSAQAEPPSPAAGLPARITEAEPPARPTSLVGGYVALGAAGALAVGGAIAWQVHQDNAAVWNDSNRCLRPGEGTRGAQCGGYETTANVALALEIAGFAGAGLSAALGVWLVWPMHRGGTASAVRCAPDSPLSLACIGTF